MSCGRRRSVLDDAALGGVPLLDAARSSGAAFVLDKQAPRSATVDAGDDWLVEVREGSIVGVRRGPEATSAADAHSIGTAATQRGLDLLSIRGLGDLLIRHTEDENAVWWRETSGERVVRAVAVAPLFTKLPKRRAKTEA
jgi:hypothetical protein